MKLIASLNTASIPGNVSGTLSLYFSALNQNDVGANGTWLVQPDPAGKSLAVYTLPGGEVIALGLQVAQDTTVPGQFGLKGDMSVRLPNGTGSGGLLVGSAYPPPFLAGAAQPGYTQNLSKRGTDVPTGVVYDFAVQCTYSWDGTNGTASGPWSVKWTVPPSAPSNLKIFVNP